MLVRACRVSITSGRHLGDFSIDSSLPVVQGTFRMSLSRLQHPGLERRALACRRFAWQPVANKVAGMLPRSVPVRNPQEHWNITSVTKFGVSPSLSAALQAMDIQAATEIQVQHATPFAA
jgi:hypothetical protein